MAMTLKELQNRLQEERYGHLIHESGATQVAYAGFRVQKTDTMWEVIETERGEKAHAWLADVSESEACQYWYERMRTQSLNLCSSKSEVEIDGLEKRLSEAGIESSRNVIPNFNGPNDPLYFLFVEGADLARAFEVWER